MSAQRFHPARLATAVLAGLVSTGMPASARRGDDAMQAIADVVLIESECREIDVDYDRLFGFAERNGIAPADIMPAGARRRAFQADYDRRASEMPTERLCIDLAAEREATVPGVFLQR